MLLLQLYYQGIQTINEPYNYFYFNGDNDTYILVDFKNNDNFNKKFSNESEINLLLFIKLIDNNIIKEINGEINFTILDVYLKNGRVKVTLGICKGKKQYDKRETIKNRDINREIQRELSNKLRG